MDGAPRQPDAARGEDMDLAEVTADGFLLRGCRFTEMEEEV